MLEGGSERGWGRGKYQHKTDNNGETGDLDGRISQLIE